MMPVSYSNIILCWKPTYNYMCFMYVLYNILFIYVDLGPAARIRKWYDPTSDEIRVHMALNMYMGVLHKPTMEMYWAPGMFETLFIPRLSSYNRYFLLDNCLHFVDTSIPLPPTATHTEQSLWRIKPFFDAIVKNFREVYSPEENIAIDESLMLYKGRLPMKQFIPTKRARFGLKLYELCESGSGYIWNSIVHTGRADQMELVDSTDNLVSSRIVLTLVEDLLDRGYQFFVDNFYSSPVLFLQLFQRNMYAVGTVRTGRRGMPATLRTKIARGTMKVMYTQELMALKWHDKKEVTMLSTVHIDDTVEVSKYGKRKEIPLVIYDYNQSMGGVDQADQMLTAYPKEGKRRKIWYKKFFRHLLNQAVHNSYNIHRKLTRNSLTHVQFIEKLIKSNCRGIIFTFIH